MEREGEREKENERREGEEKGRRGEMGEGMEEREMEKERGGDLGGGGRVSGRGKNCPARLKPAIVFLSPSHSPFPSPTHFSPLSWAVWLTFVFTKGRTSLAPGQ